MGLPPGEAIGTQWDTIAAPEDRLRFVTSLTDDPVTAGEQWKRFGFPLPGPIDRIVLVTAKPVLDVDGEVSGWVGTLADVTDAAHEQEAVEARHVAEEKYRRIVETTTDGIWVIDAENRTTFVNQAMAEMLRTSVEDMDRHPMGDFYDKLEGPVIEASIERQRAGVSGAIDVRLRRRDGTVLHAAMSTSPIFDENGMYDGSLAIVRDLAERMEQDERRKALEEQLRQSQRLESIGQLTGGIAHDFNNLLLGIRGFCELALGRLRRGEDTAGEYVEDILEAADRATLLTKQLLAFGRRQVLQPEVLDLRHVVASMERLLRQLVGDHVELVVSSPETPVLVEADRSQLEQVIMNLAVNARDAIGDGGVLTIAVSLSSGQVPEATLAVSDTGCGMDAETMARVFEPFYSTKGDSGTGLGLATVHGIVSQSGGRLGLDSAPGAGTTFSVFLPLSAGAKPPSAATPAAGASEGGADTILVVEDDPMVRTIVTAILDDLGYRVLKADGGEAALELAAAWESEIDLILTDLVMPGMSGRETAERVRERFPAAKILYMSGYTDDVVIRGGAFDPGTAFIQKPFGANELGRAVSDALSLELA
jgi:PAS domain S-box-containing protein